MHRSQIDAFLIIIFGLLVSEEYFRVEWRRAIKLEHSTILVEAARKTRTVWLRFVTNAFSQNLFCLILRALALTFCHSESWCDFQQKLLTGWECHSPRTSASCPSTTLFFSDGLCPVDGYPVGHRKSQSALVPLWTPCCADQQWFDLPMFPLSLLQQNNFSASL